MLAVPRSFSQQQCICSLHHLCSSWDSEFGCNVLVYCSCGLQDCWHAISMLIIPCKTSCFQKVISRSHSAGTVQNNEKSYFYMSSTSIIKESVHTYLVICIVLVVEPYWDYTHSDWSITSLSHNANGGAHIDLLFPFPFVGFWLLMLAAPSFHLDLFWSLVVNVEWRWVFLIAYLAWSSTLAEPGDVFRTIATKA